MSCGYRCGCGCGQWCACGVPDLPPELHGKQFASEHPAPIDPHTLRAPVTCELDGCDLAMGHFCKHQNKATP